jgi:hypothetical protein
MDWVSLFSAGVRMVIYVAVILTVVSVAAVHLIGIPGSTWFGWANAMIGLAICHILMRIHDTVSK